MYSLIVYSPIFIILSIFPFWFFISGTQAMFLIAFSTFVSIIFSFDALLFIVSSSFELVYEVSFEIFKINFFTFNWSFGYFDSLTLSITCLITFITFFVQIFSLGYIAHEVYKFQFSFYLGFFIFSILLLVGSSNFFQLFFGWEFVGLASFLLINFWFARQDANISAYKAIAVNRVGDCFLLLSIFIFFYVYNTIVFDMIIALHENNFWTSLAFLFLILGAFAKSAQFLFHGWLPDAMEGPTPVSALLHSATIVTAGVFLTLRFLDILATFHIIRYVVVFFGLLTALYAISIAAVSDDTKRATAYTTLNQLGFIFFGCGSLAGATVLFHLIVHGFYKSFSFLSTAMELYDLEDEQDGEFDHLDSTNNFSYFDFLSSLAFVSINAIPFTSPSISKEFILLSGMETSSEYLTFIVTAVLFSSPIDEGRDDNDDYSSYFYYVDDLYTPSTFPQSIIISVTSLGIISIFSSVILEEFFLDINFNWSAHEVAKFNWLDMKGSILIFLPFLSIILSEFDTSRVTKVEDFNFTPIISRLGHRYQALLFNADLWFYEQCVSRFLKKFYEFTNFFANQSLDKAYFEYFYVELINNISEFFASYNKYNLNSIEKAYPSISIFVLSIFIFLFIFSNYLWIITILFVCEIFYFFFSIFTHDDQKKL